MAELTASKHALSSQFKETPKVTNKLKPELQQDHNNNQNELQATNNLEPVLQAAPDSTNNRPKPKYQPTHHEQAPPKVKAESAGIIPSFFGGGLGIKNFPLMLT